MRLTLESYAAPSADVDEAADADESSEEGGMASGATTPEPSPRAVRTGGTGSGSRSGVGEVVIRLLDPRLRSAIMVEDGVRRVVINSRYPLCEVRKGDLCYQLETVPREVCVTIPESNVPEFERRVNELMLVSLGLAERRRRSRRKKKDQSGLWRQE